MTFEQSFPSVRESLSGKHLLLTGGTGFLGKAILALLFDRDPGLAKITLPIRPPSGGGSATDRFLREVAASDCFEPIRRKHGSNFRRFLADRVSVVEGDVSTAGFGLPDDEAAALGESVDAVIHCAGLVDFLPPLDRSLKINVEGTRHVLNLVRPYGRAAFIHVSTCYVAGEREGQIDEELDPGDFPRREHSGYEGFDAEGELVRAAELMDRLRRDADDPAALAEVWEEARGSKHRARRFTQERIKWRSRELGVERAARWGWPNTYTYGKSIAERLVLAARRDLPRTTIVRPAVIESSMTFPAPGWNQGGNTSAPLVFLAGQGHRLWPVAEGHILDVIPVDYAAAATIAITARAAVAEVPSVYHIGSSHENPFYTRRVVELASLRYRRVNDPSVGTFLRAKRRHLEPVPVSTADYDKWSAPLAASLVGKVAKAAKWLSRAPFLPPQIEPGARSAVQSVERTERSLRRLDGVIGQYKPFLAGPIQVFRTDNVRRLYDSMSEEDQRAYPYDVREIDWRHYWMDVHIPGLERHAFPELRARLRAEAAFLDVGGPDDVRLPDSLLEVLDEAADRNGDKAALTWIQDPEDAEPESVSFDEWRRRAIAVGRRLRDEVKVVAGDRVALVSENRPAWGVAYFGILAADATNVPLDSQLAARDVASLVRVAGCRAVIVSRARLEVIGVELRRLLAEQGNGNPPATVIELDELMERAGRDAPELSRSVRLLESTPQGEPPPASIIFTSGTTGAPKGVVLTHGNFASQVVTLGGLFPVSSDDRILGVLPLHHAFEFTAGFLLPLYRSAPVTYLREPSVDAVRRGLAKIKPTAMIGVPALWEAFWRQVVREVRGRGQKVEVAVRAALEAHRALRNRAGVNLGKTLFAQVHEGFGGSLRFVVSGGAAIGREVLEGLQALGIDIYEGYGLTEASPVVATTRPGESAPAGCVGHPIPEVEVAVRDPDGEGVGEIIVRGPGVMAGYWANEAETERAIGDGWLRTGDLGRLDDEGRLYVVGRSKEVIVDPAGNTVYPEEVEEAYADCVDIGEIAVAAVEVAPQKEVVGCLVVPRADGDGGLGGARERILEHFKEVDKSLPRPKRVQVLRFTATDLPRTATRKVKRALISRQLAEMLRPELDPRRARSSAGPEVAVPDKIRRVVAQVAGIDPSGVRSGSNLVEDLGVDSLMMTELLVGLEAELGMSLPDNLDGAQTVGDLVTLTAGSDGGPAILVATDDRPDDAGAPVMLPGPIRAIGRRVVAASREVAYSTLLDVKVAGRGNIPRHTNVIVAANHASHIDIGLVKTAVGDVADGMLSLGAKDYFFGGRWSRAYFDNFTDVIPFDRAEGVRESLEKSVGFVRGGQSIVIFPEGTRSPTGRMQRFRPGLGYLVMHGRTGVLPLYLHGTHAALPKGATFLRGRDVEARIGPFLSHDRLVSATEGLARREVYRVITDLVFEAVAALRDGRRFDLDEARERVLSPTETVER